MYRIVLWIHKIHPQYVFADCINIVQGLTARSFTRMHHRCLFQACGGALGCGGSQGGHGVGARFGRLGRKAHGQPEMVQ